MQKAVQHLHDNLQHPDNSTLVRSLRTAGCHEEAVEAARRLHCDVCDSLKPASSVKKSAILKATKFGQYVALDLLFLEDASGTVNYPFLNVVDVATRFQLCTPIRSKRPDDVLSAFEWVWMSWAGPPENLQFDPGRELGREFADALESYGIQPHETGVQAPWQNGICERHGGAWKLAARHLSLIHI